MITIFQIAFWIGLFLIIYSAIGYPFILYFLVQVKRVFKGKREVTLLREDELPEVTLIIPAYNEASYIEEKVMNSLALDYPKEKKKILFITDGSSDATPDIISKYKDQGVDILHRPERCGKSAALNRAIQFADTPYVVCCDANTALNKEALKLIMSHYQDEKVGAVCGEKKVITPISNGAASEGEGAYWKYESQLKKWDAELTSVMGGAGELFSVKKDLYPNIPENIILDDFYITMKIFMKRYRVAYEDKAYATETSSASVRDEMKRKVRIASGGFQIMLVLLPLLNFFKYGLVSFQYISHRVLRWLVVPFALPTLFIINLYLAIELHGIYAFLFSIQTLAYSIAIFGSILKRKKLQIKGILFPYYYAFMNYCVLLGFIKFIKGNHSAVWEKVNRQ